jgi:peptide chain release factor 2
LKKNSLLSKTLSKFDEITKEAEYINELLDLTVEENTDDLNNLNRDLLKLENTVSTLKVQAMFKNATDSSDAFVEINPGAGGTESQDWAENLERIYLRWAALRGFKVETVNRLSGEEAGIKNVILKIEGENVYGWLKHETGVHRLVRVSPFNAQGKRQTSFASVLVLPILEETGEIKINPSDIKIDTYKSSGAGGQHVNTTDSAVRITHIPTGIVVACQDGRSQHKNKEQAFKVLLSRLYELEERKKRQQKDSIEKDDISWGNQIRNYVLHPYKLVKDTRTKFETSNTEKILNGEIDDFLKDCIIKLK